MRLKIIITAMAAFLIGAFCFAKFSSYPMVWLTRFLFELKPYTMPENYDELKSNIEIIRNINYQSKYKNGVLDIIKPAVITGREKLIFYTHGGGFIEGDKTNVEHYFVMLANEGFVTVNINYALAPEHASYPQPVHQLQEAYTFIKEHSAQYSLNINDVYFSGDSAGGQLSAQFVAMQTNPGYLSLMNSSGNGQFDSVVAQGTIRGILLFCALYDFEQMVNPPPDTIKLPLAKLGLAYFKNIDPENKNIALACITDKVTENFPRAFVTDGNSNSFEFQAKEFVKKLQSLNVPVASVFYNKDEVQLGHVYQFFMDNPYALKTYQKVLEFLKE
ncbi:alpha/beta hydrolase [Spirochaetia bacterium]|nr:alpha/beta hydrolase [Spirochaetia bacterium]